MPFLTPDYPPDKQTIVRRILLPANNKWSGNFDGHLLELCQVWNWEKHGEMTAVESAQWWRDHYDEFTTDFDETPNSDNPDDLDGSPKNWSWENIYDWVIAGFLAITFTPLAAVVYNATVPKLRVAFRTGDIGALFRVLINGIEVWTGDSYAPITGVIDKVFDTSGLSTPYVVRVEHAGIGAGGGEQSKLEFIRGESQATDMDVQFRVNNCELQWKHAADVSWINLVDLATCAMPGAQGPKGDKGDTGAQGPKGDKGDTGAAGAAGDAIVPIAHVVREAGTTYTFDMVCPAYGGILLPILLENGDSVQLTELSGGWSNELYNPVNDPTTVWTNPNGTYYNNGLPTPVLESWNDSPLGALVAVTSGDGASSALQVYDMEKRTLTMPTGSTAQMIFYRAGTFDFREPYPGEDSGKYATDRQIAMSGFAKFRVEVVTAGNDTWEQTFDFTIDAANWRPSAWNGYTWAAYSAGVGFLPNDGYIIIGTDLPVPVPYMTEFHVWLSWQTSEGRCIVAYEDMQNPSHAISAVLVEQDNHGYHYAMTGAAWSPQSSLQVFNDAGSGHVVYRVMLRGNGSNPFV